MPLIILGLIVVLGGCLLIYYQLGPKITLRLKGSGLFGGEEAADETTESATTEEPQADASADEKSKDIHSVSDSESGKKIEKVIYVYGDGEREERTFE